MEYFFEKKKTKMKTWKGKKTGTNVLYFPKQPKKLKKHILTGSMWHFGQKYLLQSIIWY